MPFPCSCVPGGNGSARRAWACPPCFLSSGKRQRQRSWFPRPDPPPFWQCPLPVAAEKGTKTRSVVGVDGRVGTLMLTVRYATAAVWCQRRVGYAQAHAANEPSILRIRLLSTVCFYWLELGRLLFIRARCLAHTPDGIDVIQTDAVCFREHTAIKRHQECQCWRTAPMKTCVHGRGMNYILYTSTYLLHPFCATYRPICLLYPSTTVTLFLPATLLFSLPTSLLISLRLSYCYCHRPLLLVMTVAVLSAVYFNQLRRFPLV